MEIILSVDRLSCIGNEFLRIVNTKEFESAKLIISETELKIVPLSAPIKIVLCKA